MSKTVGSFRELLEVDKELHGNCIQRAADILHLVHVEMFGPEYGGCAGVTFRSDKGIVTCPHGANSQILTYFTEAGAYKN